MSSPQSKTGENKFSNETKFWQVSVQVQKENSLRFQEFFMHSGAVGFFELLYQEGVTNNLHEDATWLFFFFEESFPAAAFAFMACSLLGESDAQPNCTKVKYQDYLKQFEKTFRAFALSEKTWLLPPWHKPQIPAGCRSFILKPGMAFGTGKHVTSQLMASYIERYVKDGDTVFDLGCGSGILSLMAATWGAQKVVGVDVEKLSVEAACENASLNTQLTEKTFFTQADFSYYQSENFSFVADIFLANILASVFYAHSDELKKYLQLSKHWALSGITVSQKDEFINFLHKNEQRNFLIEEKEDWLMFFKS